MTPSEVAEKLLGLGICFQIAFKQKGLPDILASLGGLTPNTDKEDFSQLGFNAEKEDDEQTNHLDELLNLDKDLEVITNPDELSKFTSWLLAINPPPKANAAVTGTVLVAKILKDRRLQIVGDDIPFGLGAIEQSFCCEYINDIRMIGSEMLVIETTFGQTGIRIPLQGK